MGKAKFSHCSFYFHRDGRDITVKFERSRGNIHRESVLWDISVFAPAGVAAYPLKQIGAFVGTRGPSVTHARKVMDQAFKLLQELKAGQVRQIPVDSIKEVSYRWPTIRENGLDCAYLAIWYNPDNNDQGEFKGFEIRDEAEIWLRYYSQASVLIITDFAYIERLLLSTPWQGLKTILEGYLIHLGYVPHGGPS